MIRLASCILLFGSLLMASRPVAAQDVAVGAPLEEFVQQVARLWLAGDVAALVDLLPAENRLTLDTGTGTETANSRHVSAALRALFSERETVSARPVRATLASARPPRGFGELAWTFRVRGTPGEQSRSVYVATLWEDGAWRITELRIMP